MVKSDDEIARIRRSVLTNSKALEKTSHPIRPGISEAAIAAELEYQMRRLGGEKAAFDTIVARRAQRPAPRRPPPGSSASDELLLIDMGTCQDGYMSDMTRMLFLGQPSKRSHAHVSSGPGCATGRRSTPSAPVEPGHVDRKARQVLGVRTGYGKQLSIPPGMAWALKSTSRRAWERQTRRDWKPAW